MPPGQHETLHLKSFIVFLYDDTQTNSADTGLYVTKPDDNRHIISIRQLLISATKTFDFVNLN